jgi:Acetyltransferases
MTDDHASVDDGSVSGDDRSNAGRVTIRRGESTDGPAVRRLQSALREPSPRLLDHALRTGELFVAAADGRPVGYVLPVAGRETHVAELVVSPAYRRRGVATRLLERVLRAVDDRVTLFVHPDNDPARRLYDAVGFRQTDRRPNFYDDADALVLAHDADE